MLNPEAAVAAGVGMGTTSTLRRASLWPALPLALSAACWVILFSTVPPGLQEFPLADDFNFARGFFTFERGGGVHYGGWSSMPLLGQWLWAAPFALAFGDHLLVLRLSTVVVGWLGLAAFFGLLVRQGIGTAVAAFATSALALNPLFLMLQGTYMSDIPALSFALLALAGYARAQDQSRGSWLALTAAAAAASLAVATRQTAVAAPAAAAICLWWQPTLRWRPGWLVATWGPVALGLAIHTWFEARPDVIGTESRIPTLPIAAAYLFALVHVCGLSALPVLALDFRPALWAGRAGAWVSDAGPRTGPRLAAGGSAFLLVGMSAGAIYWYWHPALVMYDKGLFPYLDGIVTVFGPYMGQAGREPIIGLAWRVGLTAAGCAGSAALLWRCVSRLGSGVRPDFVTVFALLQVPMILAARYVFDRYFLGVLPWALATAAWGGVVLSRRSWPGWLLLAALGLAGLGLTHDWLAFNAARWALGRHAVQARGLDPLEIDGGFEWNGWWSRPDAGRSPRYTLAFAPLPGTRVVDTEVYTQWLPPRRRSFFLLEPGGEADVRP